MNHNLDSSFWNSKYKEQDTGWDLGETTPFFEHYINFIDKSKIICFPGAGYGHDPIFYAENGYKVYAIEYAQTAAMHMIKKNINNLHVLNSDFFQIDKSYNNFFDIVIEYTFYCAFDPKLRNKYFDKIYNILRPGGEIIGLFLPINKDDLSGPPFKISLNEIKNFIKNKFVIKDKYFTEHSIDKRKGNELFLRLQKIEN